MSHFVFPKWTNALVATLGLLALSAPLYAVGLVWFGFSPKTLVVGYQPEQPVAFFSHRTHAGDLGMDCRYCHNTVERAAKAAIPPTQTCMNCHHAIFNVPDATVTVQEGAPPIVQRRTIQPIINSYYTGEPILWRRVHDLPDYAFFDHSAHVTRGVSCVECHGRVEQMDKVEIVSELSMKWCLDCHRKSDIHLREPRDVFNLGLDLGDEDARMQLGASLRTRNQINPSTDCSTCHR
ncbi:MAG: cytochrome c3 family protein [Phycisphaerales bacterium]